MKGGLGGMMKQFQQMQAKMEAMQAELEQTEVEGTAGGGMVHVKMNGKHEVLNVAIDPSVVDKDDVEMLQDLIKAAVSQAHQKVQDLQAERMSGITGGLNLPPGMGLPF
ncbi:MAG: YbaB/EbfC family nucleoid-associated protein [Candidatus Zixiibacteriota bacterium]